MQNQEIYDLVVKVVIAMKDVILGGAGGIIAYMFNYTKQKETLEDIKWSNQTMFINLCIGAFVAYSLGTFVPLDTAGRDGIIGLIGVTSYAILGIVESRFAKIVMDRILGGKSD